LQVWETGDCPAGWTKSVFIPLPKTECHELLKTHNLRVNQKW